MRFAAIALATGLAGMLFAANVQGTALSGVAEAVGVSVSSRDDAGSNASPNDIALAEMARPEAVRLIDLRSGRTCKGDAAVRATATFTDAPFGYDCKTSPLLARIAYWREAEDGTLIMADRGGGTILEFVPGDGVLYESVYPTDALITIVPARG